MTFDSMKKQFQNQIIKIKSMLEICEEKLPFLEGNRVDTSQKVKAQKNYQQLMSKIEDQFLNLRKKLSKFKQSDKLDQKQIRILLRFQGSLKDYQDDFKVLKTRVQKLGIGRVLMQQQQDKIPIMNEEEEKLVNRNQKLGVLNRVSEDITQTGKSMAKMFNMQEEKINSSSKKVNKVNTSSLLKADSLLNGIRRMEIRNNAILGLLIGLCIATFIFLKFFK